MLSTLNRNGRNLGPIPDKNLHPFDSPSSLRNSPSLLCLRTIDRTLYLFDLILVIFVANFVLVAQAVEHSNYSVEHIRYLVRNEFVRGQKIGRIWLVDLADLQRYEQTMTDAGSTKFTPKDKRQE